MSYQPNNLVGLRVPLFDRLVDSAPEQTKEAPPMRVYTRQAVYDSIARDVGRLLNTRRSSPRTFNQATATVLDYGLPSFSHLNAASATDRRVLAESVRETVAFFEPRALNVSIQVEPDPERPAAMLGWIHCDVRIGSLIEPVTFAMVVENRKGVIEVLPPDLSLR